MASPSRSPTPSKTPDTNIRKSGSFHNLSKHSISQDVHQRSSRSKAETPSRSLRASLELKENERDHHSLRQEKVKSPAMASLKNFMAPTISASSKVVAASPRRRILGDRNEMVSVLDSIVEILPVAGFDGKQSIEAAKEDSMAAASEMEGKSEAASEMEGKSEESLLAIHPVSDELGMMGNQVDLTISEF